MTPDMHRLRISSALAATITMLSCIALGSGGATTANAVKADVAERLVDPGSALFRGVHRVAPGRWEGEVSAKTGDGAYRPFSPFVWTRSPDGHADVAIATD